MQRLTSRISVCALMIAGAVAIGRGQTERKYVPVTDAMLQKPESGRLAGVAAHAGRLGLQPARSDQPQQRLAAQDGLDARPDRVPAIQEGTPLVHDGVMYRAEPRRQHPRRRREDRRHDLGIQAQAAGRRAAEDEPHAGDLGQPDHQFELGQFHLRAQRADRASSCGRRQCSIANKRAPTSGGPIIANGKVITGRQCQPDAGRDSCVVTAHDAKTGKEVWRFHTIPGPGEPDYESWGDVPMEQRWHVGTWMVPSYDPELNLIYVGTSVTIPAPKFTLGGNDKQHLYHNCTLAMNADTGKIVWYYQHIVDHWDLDHPFERLLVDTVVAPDASDVVDQPERASPASGARWSPAFPGKTGIVYTLDRQTGEFLWARPTVMQNVVSTSTARRARSSSTPKRCSRRSTKRKFVCPGSSGGKNWPAGAYSPQTNTMYMPMQNMCMTATTTVDTRDPSKVYGISMSQQFAPGADKVGTVWAISAETGQTTWKYEQRAGMLSLVATAGGLVFGGDSNGRFKALDDKTGKVLWEINVGSPVSGYPVSVRGRPESSTSRRSSGRRSRPTPPEGLTPELKTGIGPNIFVFALAVTCTVRLKVWHYD